MIEFLGLQKIIKDTTVIDIQEFFLLSGEIAAIVGPAGSGKSKLLNLLIGKSRPTAGSIRVVDGDPTERKTVIQHVGVLFSEDSLYLRQSVRQNLLFQASLYGVSKPRVDEVLVGVGLADHANVRAEKLPSGLARRLAFGRAILHHPKALILCQPFDRCDETTIVLLTGLLRKHAQNDGGVLILANDTANLQTVCDTIYKLNQGRLTDVIKPSEDEQAVFPFKIPVRLEGKVALINPSDILFADAAEGRAYLQTRDGRLPTQFTLSELEQRLARSGFFRAHRSYVVNLQHVKEVIPYTRNSFSLRLNDENNTEIPLSKSAAGELRDLLGY